MQRELPQRLQPQPSTVDRDLVRRKAQQLRNGKLLSILGRPASAPASGTPTDAESAWSRRYTSALKRYEGLDLGSPEAVKAVIEGLEEWARLVPQRSVGADGKPEPANKWGLGAERCVLRSLRSHLVARGQPTLAAGIQSEMTALLDTAAALDRCCQQPVDRHSEKRLCATARIQTKALIKLLSVIQLDTCLIVRGSKRGAPRRRDPLHDQRLVKEWARARGKAGMTRKEFCALKNISFRAFIQAQDRHRKRSAE